ncbi:hypothetical protein BCR43DRAFT_505033 [Syncephalastrum racemosum]|uniref:Uncharacterized protein n=1 Tax=Syncephalastrum racemosum TaxID=13706 RepID=A0A1X2H0A0_SYNRA|nr:hypothetical protein BCR43DRAFT_519410 [Syncephalastrum racemosum]ORY89239.1 hypothetical protein BCR43DRAFT_539604 [Syncephalastrum racemosum]ORY89243.1 hypothetical protein BCR43DRAFT_519417 [Syncephalastrum racemosum]ORY98242.1 hypothetical protein BCR43DRAFT_505033 [Syncephalastrum racemosum]
MEFLQPSIRLARKGNRRHIRVLSLSDIVFTVPTWWPSCFDRSPQELYYAKTATGFKNFLGLISYIDTLLVTLPLLLVLCLNRSISSLFFSRSGWHALHLQAHIWCGELDAFMSLEDDLPLARMREMCHAFSNAVRGVAKTDGLCVM